ncbi:class I SAM-dependent methyltransferase [Streptomonospora sp. PA3]|uniref:class I SAM-dependent methyltransferase n=1 Tax=Streptomonospora sp. PA3 TaxID=2607326 RepID=UPI0012DEE3F9|nr:class I SAM-dependent methyltransferase [Streptomonospora sp. PA3]MUL41407.1 class I SAM-dependent methyltransferase [Streptomonospora sp. PA3]
MERTIANTHQYEAWNGYEGRHWARNPARYEAMVGGFNRPLFGAARIGPGDRVLDIGCGTGLTTRRAALKAPHGRALGVDLSAPMLERARTVAAEKGIANAAFEQGDAQVHPFPAGAFDVVISRGGTWYFADPAAAFANIGSALRPGGRLAIGTPDSTGDAADTGFPDLFRIMGEFLPEPPVLATEDAERAPATMSTPGDVEAVLYAAGFTSVAVERCSAEAMLGRTAEDAADFVFEWGPVRHWFRHTDPETELRAREAVRAALAPYEAAGGVRQPGTGLVVTAVRG